MYNLLVRTINARVHSYWYPLRCCARLGLFSYVLLVMARVGLLSCLGNSVFKVLCRGCAQLLFCFRVSPTRSYVVRSPYLSGRCQSVAITGFPAAVNDAECSGAPTSSSKPAAKGVAKKAAKAKKEAKAGKKNLNDGTKACADCGKVLPLDAFAPSQSLCSELCEKVRKNVRAAAKAEGLLDWFNESYKDAKAWKKIKAYYTKCVGAMLGRAQKLQHVTDSVFEMGSIEVDVLCCVRFKPMRARRVIAVVVGLTARVIYMLLGLLFIGVSFDFVLFVSGSRKHLFGRVWMRERMCARVRESVCA